MVYTRNQKRNIEYDDDEYDVNLELDDVYMCKSRKKKQCIESDDEDEDFVMTEDINTSNETPVTESLDMESEGSVKDDSTSRTYGLRDVVAQIVNTCLPRAKKREATVVETEYDKLVQNIDDIQNGIFFERVPLEDDKDQVRGMYTDEQLKELNGELQKLRENYKKSAPSVLDIVKLQVPDSHKQKLLEKVYNYANADILTSEYNSSLKYLLEHINKTQEPELFALEQQIIKCAQSEEVSDDYRRKILKSKMSFDNKVLAYKRLEDMEQYEDTDNSEFSKYKNWMDKLLSVPYGKYIPSPCLGENNIAEIQDYVQTVRNVLDKRLSFLEKPKDQIINIVSQTVRNPDITFNAIGLYGVAGLGKTSIASSIAEALGRPFRTISLGGESDSSMLLGHNFTYVGSGPGRLIDILSETKCMNPVILLDELDKVSETHHGKEIIGSLIHLTDSSTNSKYNYDRYFSGVEFDLSKVLFIFTYNDPTKIDRILSDRLFKIKLENYTTKEKLEIANKHLVSNTLKLYNFTEDQIIFDKETLEYIIHGSREDQGMRGIKRKFEIIISRINTLMLTKPEENIIKLKYKSLYPYYSVGFPVTVLKEHVDILLLESTSNPDQDMGPPPSMYM
jgi:ATP-dependent Lon protease